MAAILLARKLARGEAMARGAHVCMGLLTLADFEPEFARWGMQIDVVGKERASMAHRRLEFVMPASEAVVFDVFPLPRVAATLGLVGP